ncbi:hypothetical protein ABPG74_006306 [Tetrahymena malaccensis]
MQDQNQQTKLYGEDLSQIDEELSKQDIFLQHLKKVYGYRKYRCKSTEKIKNKQLCENQFMIQQRNDQKNPSETDSKFNNSLFDLQKQKQCNKATQNFLDVSLQSQEDHNNLSTNECENKSIIDLNADQSITKNTESLHTNRSNYIELLRQERCKLHQSQDQQISIKKRINILKQHEDNLRRVRQESKTTTLGIYSTKRRIFEEELIKQDIEDLSKMQISIRNENARQIREQLAKSLYDSKQKLKDKMVQEGAQVRLMTKANEEQRQKELEQITHIQRERVQKVKEQLNRSHEAIERFKEQKQMDYKKSYEQKLTIHKYLVNEKQKELNKLKQAENQLVKKLSSSKILTLQQNKMLQFSYYHNIIQVGEQYPQIKKEYEEKNNFHALNSASKSPKNNKSQNSSFEKSDSNSILRRRQSNYFTSTNKNDTSVKNSNKNLLPYQQNQFNFKSCGNSPKRSSSVEYQINSLQKQQQLEMKQGSGKFQSKNQQNNKSQNNSQLSVNQKRKKEDSNHQMGDELDQHQSIKQSNYLDESKLNQNEHQILDQQEMTESQQYYQDNDNLDQNYRDDDELGHQNQSYNLSQQENHNPTIHASELQSQNNFDNQYQNDEKDQNNPQKNQFSFKNSSQLSRKQQMDNEDDYNYQNQNYDQTQQNENEDNQEIYENHKSQAQASRNSSQESKSIHQSNLHQKQHKKSEIHGNPQSWNHIEYDEQGEPIVVQQEVNHYTNHLNNSLKKQQVKVNSTSQKQTDSAKKQKKSEIDGNPTSWNHIEFNEQGDPIVVKQQQNAYHDYVSKNQNKKPEKSKEAHIENKETLKVDNFEKSTKQSFVSVNSKQDINQSTTEIIPQKINLTYEEYMNQNKDHFKQIEEETKEGIVKTDQKNQNVNSKKEQKTPLISKNQDKNDKSKKMVDQSNHNTLHVQQVDAKKSTNNLLKEDHLDIDQRSVQEHSVITNNMNFDNQTIQDEELRGEYEEDTNINSLIDDRLSTKKMMISDKSFKIDLILNHQPTISPENLKYAENKEKFQLFFQRNADKILKQIQKQGIYKESQNESVIKFQDFQQFINKMFESDNFIIIESEQNRQNIMKNKNISLILSTLLKEFLKTVRKFDDKTIVDEKNFELGIEDMMDFFEFWIRVDDQIQVKYDYSTQPELQNETLSKSQNPQKQQSSNQSENQSKEQQKPQQPAFAQARLKSLLEGNIKKLETIQNESMQIDTQQQNIINQTLQFLKSQYKKFEKKSLEDQQNEKVQTILSDSDVSLIQQQITAVFKDYSTMFSAQSKKQTFDEIQQSQNFMNINNYFKFVKEFGIQSDKVQGAQIIEIFNRNCTGKQMNYNQFLNSLLKIVEIKENCIFVDQKTQIIAIAKMLKLKIQLNTKDNNKIKKYAVDNSSSTKSIKSQNRSLSPKNESSQSQNSTESNKLNWSDLEKLSYQQINSLGNKKASKTEQNLSPQKVNKREVVVKKAVDSNNNQINKTDEQNKNKKNTDDNFNPNDLIDADDEHETNEILDKQYRITKQAIIRKKSPAEREENSPKLPPINGYNSDLSSKPLSEISSKKDSITNVRMIRQINKSPKAQSTSPPPKQIQPIAGNIAKSPRLNGINAYSMRYKNGNGVQSINRGSQSPNIRNTIPSKKPLINESAEKSRSPKLLAENIIQNNSIPQQQLSPPIFQQQNNPQEEQAIQDAIMKSTQFRNFLKNRAMQIQNDLVNINKIPNPQDFNTPTKFQNEQQQQMQNPQFAPQQLPPFSYQQQQQQPQQNFSYKKNNLQQQHNQIQQQQYPSPQLQPQSPSNMGIIPQNIISGNYSFGKINQYANNLNNDQNIPNQAFARGSQLLPTNVPDNFQNSGVRVIPVMNHQGFSQDKMQ